MGIGADIATTTSPAAPRFARLVDRWPGLFGSTARKGGLALFDQVLVSGARFVTTVVVGRMCGPDILGVYSLAFTLLIFIAAFQESLILLPYTVYGNRLEGEPRRQYAGAVLLQLGMLALLSMACLAVGAAVIPPGGELVALRPVLWMLVGVVPFALLRDFCRRISFAHMNMGWAVLLDAAVAAIQLGGLALLATAGLLSATTAYLVVGVASGIAGLAWLYLSRRHFTLHRDGLRQAMRRNWSFGKWVFAGAMTSVLHGYSLYWLLALVLDTATTGVFAACETVVALSNPFILGIGNILMPRSAQAIARGGSGELRRVVGYATLITGAAMAAFCAAVAVFGGKALLLLYGAEYAGHGWTITLLALAVLASSLGMTANDGLYVLERPDVNFKAGLLGLFVMAVTTACLLVPAGLHGVAIGLLAGNASGSAAKWVVFLRVARAHTRLEDVA